MELKTIKVDKKTWDKLSRMKIDLEAQNLAEVIERVLEIVPASKLKEKVKENDKR